MRFLDSSILVPVFVEDHPHHEASINLYTSCSAQGDCCASHSLAEVYSTLTRLPYPQKATPVQAVACVEDIARRFRFISLEGQEYISVLQESAKKHIIGGTVYDALIARCALTSGADVIFTWNIRHYQLFGPEVAKRLRTPVG